MKASTPAYPAFISFSRLVIETLGPINCDGQVFIGELGYRVSAITEDPRETAFFCQRLSAAVQRFNAVCFLNSLTALMMTPQTSQGTPRNIRHCFITI
jgi:hypothetical protein